MNLAQTPLPGIDTEMGVTYKEVFPPSGRTPRPDACDGKALTTAGSFGSVHDPSRVSRPGCKPVALQVFLIRTQPSSRPLTIRLRHRQGPKRGERGEQGGEPHGRNSSRRQESPGHVEEVSTSDENAGFRSFPPSPPSPLRPSTPILILVRLRQTAKSLRRITTSQK